MARYQNLCDSCLVSPIYTVFKSTDAVDDSYSFRVQKSPLLIHFYKTTTSASVNRRGNLRYDEFSRIPIWLPGKVEQIAIAGVLDTADQQFNLLGTRRAALDQQKRGLMQRLLRGKIRVIGD
jgi:type I restriction enzyme, S subunit